ncbi:hypothetical protein PHLCEN_2v8420 [Hermanssonia centrifuga]|uniref:Non-haem dioxygenase N-terminal domain-containing protein n=1 Tax=Hermanssonia centrifuga TaxID=98765 RepID=A0A2R6NTR7_9APHY|nr:hypothetical protein PHLCEN_2v8420 [Hermanssonia centrifuga]
MPGLTKLPPFPEDVPTHPLLIIDYQLIKQGDSEEIDRLWEAATKLGFCLKNHGVDAEVDNMFEAGAETMRLPLEEKMQYTQGEGEFFFGYEAKGSSAIDDSGTPDTTEYLNISKDDALAWPEKVHREYPSTVNARMESTIKPFTQKSVEINNTLLDVLNDKLGFPKETLASKHPMWEPSSCESRCIKSHPGIGGVEGRKTTLGAHTDFVSLTFLHNRLGGLQVLPPGSTNWYYVKALSSTPPKDQANYERWSLAFFTRPANNVVLRALKEDSPMVAEAVASDPGKFETGQSAYEWFHRRTKYRMIKYRTVRNKLLSPRFVTVD